MYFITTKRMLEVCFSAHPNIQYRTQRTRVGVLYKYKNKTKFCNAKLIILTHITKQSFLLQNKRREG